MFRYKLRSLLIVLGIAPPVIALAWWFVAEVAEQGLRGWLLDAVIFVVVLTLLAVGRRPRAGST